MEISIIKKAFENKMKLHPEITSYKMYVFLELGDIHLEGFVQEESDIENMIDWGLMTLAKGTSA